LARDEPLPLSAEERAEFQDAWLRAIEQRRGDDAEQGVVDREVAEQRMSRCIEAILQEKAEREYWENRPTTDELLSEHLRCLEWHERPYQHRLQPLERLPLTKSKYSFWDDEEYTEWCEIVRQGRMAQGSAKQGATPSDIDDWMRAVWPGISSDDLTDAHDLAVNVPVPLAKLDISHPADLSDKNAHLFDVRVWRLTKEGRRHLETRSGQAAVTAPRDASATLVPPLDAFDQDIGATPIAQELVEKPSPALSNRKMYILQAMFLAGAFTADSRMTTDRIAKVAEGPEADPNGFKESIAELRRAQLIETKQGRGGGCWLTAEGRGIAKMILKR